MTCPRWNIYPDGTLNNHLFVKDLKLDLQARELRAGADGDMLSVAIMRMQIDVVGLIRLNVRDTAHHRVKTGLGFKLAIDKHIPYAGRYVRVIFNLGGRAHLGMKNIAAVFAEVTLAFFKIERLVFMCVAAIAK